MDNQRLILFIVFSFSLLLLWEAWQDKHAPPPPAVTAANAPSVSAGTPPIPSQGLNAPAAAPAQTGFAKGARAVVETDVLRATIDADGGDLRQLQLLTYRETETRNEIFTLFEEDPAQPYLAQSGLLGKDLPTHRSVFQLNPGTYRLTRGASQVEVPLVWNDPATGVRVEKIAGLDKNIALGMRAQSVRILAPIPGKAAVGQPLPTSAFPDDGSALPAGNFYVGSTKGKIFAVNAVTGAVSTFLDTGDASAVGGVVIDRTDGVLAFGTSAGTFYQVPLSDAGSFTQVQGLGPIHTTPTLDRASNAFVVGSDDGHVYAFPVL